MIESGIVTMKASSVKIEWLGAYTSRNQNIPHLGTALSASEQAPTKIEVDGRDR